jgi:uncharacterized sodium:solute symporter family permease YidK
MIASITLLLLVVLSGTIATYLYDDISPLAARACAGACLGITALSLIGFFLALVFGLATLTDLHGCVDLFGPCFVALENFVFRTIAVRSSACLKKFSTLHSEA